jgi:hypothetical protein
MKDVLAEQNLLTFCPTIKPCLTNKGSNITKDIILEDNNKIINDQLQVANNFNIFFINVAKDIGNVNNLSAEEHPSIKIIKENKKEIHKLIYPKELFFLNSGTTWASFNFSGKNGIIC